MSIILHRNIVFWNLYFPLFCKILGLQVFCAQIYKMSSTALTKECLTSFCELYYLSKYSNYSQLELIKLPFEQKFRQQSKFYSHFTLFRTKINESNMPITANTLRGWSKINFLFCIITKSTTWLNSRSAYARFTLRFYFSNYSLFDVIDADLKKIFVCEEIVNRETVPTFHELSQRDALTQVSDNLQFLIKKIINQKYFLLCLHLQNYCRAVPFTTPLTALALLTKVFKYRQSSWSNIVFLKNKTEIGSVLLISNIRLLSFSNCFLFNSLYI